MADDDQFHHTSGNWWESASRNMRFDQSGGTSQQSSSSAITNNNIVDFGWQNSDMVEIKPRSSLDNSSVVFHDTRKLEQNQDSSNSTDPNLHMMGLGLSSHSMEWNQPSLIGDEKGTENSFRSILEENLSSTRNNFEQENVMGMCQQVNRNFSLDQNQFSPQYSSGDSNVIQMDSSALYGTPSILQGSSMSSFPYATNNYGLLNSNNELNMNMPCNNWSNNKVPQFLMRTSPPKQSSTNNQLHFTNNTPFWNASEAPNSIKDVRSSFFPSLQPQFSTPNFDSHSKNISEVNTVVKKSGSEPAPKRTRNETPSTLPAFKVRKEKMGDRITALQQLVSPFGKTDTASVLSEAIEYIKFLHEQVTLLSTPYMKSGASSEIQQNSGKTKKSDGAKQDLRSRGLCLVPISSTFPVTHETTVDFWTPTFGGTSR
ncbi:transcription factor bHLH123-like isoform X2 [Vicia villosa]|uniref:transcription factor bHLH123-like isoform X2 n=1 Tax=Vicia villosa TaxID=3911 RepID=UPI00273AA064|nr:transcription factor bHLH123-like isoform X2 [Vicia villosa]